MAKRQYVEQLGEGDRIDDSFLVKSVRQGETKAGKPYLILTLMDRSGEIAGPIWDNVERFHSICQPGNVVFVRGSIGSFQGNLQLKVDDVVTVGEVGVDMGCFLPCSPKNREDMAFELQKIVHSVEDSFYRKLLLKFFKKGSVWTTFQNAPAAKGIHHAYVGGLLEHSLSVAQLAENMASHYEGIDRSLLLTGALLHDIGKLHELSYNRGVIDYTDSGRLKGHIVIGCEMVGEEGRSIRDFSEERIQQLQHLIVSHHGKQEFGSPVVPMTVEALLLSFLDDLDAKMNITEQLRRKVEGNEMEWTDYQRSMDRYLYLKGFETKRSHGGDVYDDSDPAKRQQSLF